MYQKYIYCRNKICMRERELRELSKKRGYEGDGELRKFKHCPSYTFRCRSSTMTFDQKHQLRSRCTRCQGLSLAAKPREYSFPISFWSVWLRMIASARSASIPVGREFALYVQSDLVSPYISKGGRIYCPSGLKRVSPHGMYWRISVILGAIRSDLDYWTHSNSQHTPATNLCVYSPTALSALSVVLADIRINSSSDKGVYIRGLL